MRRFVASFLIAVLAAPGIWAGNLVRDAQGQPAAHLSLEPGATLVSFGELALAITDDATQPTEIRIGDESRDLSADYLTDLGRYVAALNTGLAPRPEDYFKPGDIEAVAWAEKTADLAVLKDHLDAISPHRMGPTARPVPSPWAERPFGVGTTIGCCVGTAGVGCAFCIIGVALITGGTMVICHETQPGVPPDNGGSGPGGSSMETFCNNVVDPESGCPCFSPCADFVEGHPCC